MRFIEHIIEPNKLLLSWQPPLDAADRQRLFVAELRRHNDDADLVYLKDTDEFEQATEKGFEYYPGFSSDQNKHEDALIAFMKRLPPRSRKDFDRFLNAIRIKPQTDISDFALLGYSGAKLPDDTFTIIHPFDQAVPPFEFMLEVQGYRYYLNDVPFNTLDDQMQISFEKEPDNPKDPKAIKILFNGKRAGYVCRGLLDSFHKWLNSKFAIEAYLEKKNGTEEKPKIFLYVIIKP